MLLPAVGPEHHFRDAFSPQFKLNFRNICEVVIELGACRLKMFHFEVQGWSAETLGIQEVGPCCAAAVRNPGAIFELMQNVHSGMELVIPCAPCFQCGE